MAFKTFAFQTTLTQLERLMLNMKTCSTCRHHLPTTAFGKHKGNKDGLYTICKPCTNEKRRAYRATKDGAIKTKKARIKFAKSKAGNVEYKKQLTIAKQIWRGNIWNKSKDVVFSSNYKKEREKTDALFKFSNNLRALIRVSFKKSEFKKQNKSEAILGCSIQEFKLHIEKQFVNGMTFDNHGEWHLDHIIPISWARTEAEAIKLSHYSNLAPMWAKDNLAKLNKFNQDGLNMEQWHQQNPLKH